MTLAGVANSCLLTVFCTALTCAQEPSTPGLSSYFKAREVIDSGVDAIGGLEALRDLRTVRRQLSGEWIGSGQHPRPYAVAAPTLAAPPPNGRDQGVGFLDYGGNRWLEEMVEADVKREDFITRKNVGTENSGFETITFGQEKSYYRAFSADDARSSHVRRFRRYPEGALRMALNRPETLAWVGEGQEFGRTHKVISFTDVLGTRVLLYFDAKTGLLSKSEFLREHALAGDSYQEVVYDDYRRVGRLQLPFRYIDRVAGVPTQEMRASSIELDISLAEGSFQPPPQQDVVPMAQDPAEPSVQKLGENLFMIRGPYNIMFAVFRDHVVVFEAPLHSRYSETCLELIRATVPDKPIRYLVATHFHYDHVAGVRPYIAEGVSILTTPDAKGIIEQVASSRRTMYPDALTRHPRAPSIETVERFRVLEDGANRVELYDFGPTGHITQMLVAYFPKEKVLFQADVWDPISLELVIAGPDTVNMARKITELGLKVERIIPVHGIPATIEALKSGLAVRAKYVQ
ncbi:MAG TPA: MBL fold metallo-hydrolase [Terriglobales bacterium]|nr:MBL fold metallo-hydrolase [Terriglobales bacterium]